VSEPRNVSPDDEREGIHNAPPGAPERTNRTDWGGPMWTSRGRNFPWLGILLVLVGAALLLQAALPPSINISAGTVLLFAIGAALIAGWLFAGSWFAAIPGLLLLAFAIGSLINELGIYASPGPKALSLAVAFLLIWAIGMARPRRSNWPLWAAAILGLIGVVQISGRLTAIPELGVLWPIVIIVVGILLLVSARRRTGRSGTA
jgi:hypothetical protein